MGFLVNPDTCYISYFLALLRMAAELEWLDMKAGVSLEMILPKPGQLGKMSRGWNEDLEQKCSGLTAVVFLFVPLFFL